MERNGNTSDLIVKLLEHEKLSLFINTAAVDNFFKKNAVGIQIILVLFSFSLFGIQITRPLVDYDEATYAHVVVDTLKTGDIATLQLNDTAWFEKPPLYLWAEMLSVKIFGPHEFAFRLPSIIFSVLCLWFVYAIVRKLTGNNMAATLSFLVLLFSNTFFIFARESRLDSGVIMAILAAVFSWLRGGLDEKNYLWVFPLVAIGFLLKSVIAFLVIPIIFFYSFFYKKWSWLKSKYLWIGFGIALALLLPWHLWETIKFGSLFWDQYIVQQIFHRATSTITGTNNYYDYILVLWYYTPWIWAILLGVSTLTYFNFSKKLGGTINFAGILASLAAAVFIIVIFTLAKTHLSTYVLPAFPFLAICLGLIFHELMLRFNKNSDTVYFISIILIIIAALVTISVISVKVPEYTYEERAIGQIYKNNIPAPLYVINWNILETLNYYGDTHVTLISPRYDGGKILKAPFYLFVDIPSETYFYYDVNKPVYDGLNLLYQGKQLALIKVNKDMQLPVFKCCDR